MGKKSKWSGSREHARAEHFKARLANAEQEIRTLKQALKDKYAQGSADTFGLLYRALGCELWLCSWINTRMRALDARQKLAPIPRDIEELIIDEVLIEKAKRSGKGFSFSELAP